MSNGACIGVKLVVHCTAESNMAAMAKYRATARARCVQRAFWLFGALLFAPTACTPGYKNRSNNAEPFQKYLLSSA